LIAVSGICYQPCIGTWSLSPGGELSFDISVEVSIVFQNLFGSNCRLQNCGKIFKVDGLHATQRTIDNTHVFVTARICVDLPVRLHLLAG